MIKKNGLILTIVGAIFLLPSCAENETSETVNESEVQEQKETSEEKDAIELYRIHVKEKGIQEKKVTVFGYSFGEPDEKGLTVYECKFNEKGLLVDSISYSNNRLVMHEQFFYNENNKLIERKLFDSTENLIQRSQRTFNDKGLENGFKIFTGDSLYYMQEKEYDEKDQLIKLKEFDSKGILQLVNDFTYHESGEVETKTEMDGEGNLLLKITTAFDENGNKSSISTYGPSGKLEGKTILTKYTANGDAQLVEKYDATDSMYASYAYEYNDNGDETKATIYDGIGLIMHQGITTYGEQGKVTGFVMYEGGVGQQGRSHFEYNEAGQEIELIDYDNLDKQEKRKVTQYNDKGLVESEVNYNKIDEPKFVFKYEYKYY